MGWCNPLKLHRGGGREGTDTQRSSTANTSSHSGLGAWPLKAMKSGPDGFNPNSGNVGEHRASRTCEAERTISLIKMSLHVAEIPFDISGHLHAQLLIEFPLLLYLRCMRAETE